TKGSCAGWSAFCSSESERCATGSRLVQIRSLTAKETNKTKIRIRGMRMTPRLMAVVGLLRTTAKSTDVISAMTKSVGVSGKAHTLSVYTVLPMRLEQIKYQYRP